MNPCNAKFELRVSDLKKVQAFYSALGMQWIEGRELEIGDSGRPIRVENNPYLEEFPLLWGHLGGIEITFYLHDKPHQASSSATASTIMRLAYDNASEVTDVIKQLEKLGLLHYAKGVGSRLEPCILDPDGRFVQLFGSSAFVSAD